MAISRKLSNFQFSLYLKESGLGEQDCHNLDRIFSALRSDRQMEIIDAWPKYLDKLLEIKQYAKEERERSIKEAFSRIEKLIDETYLREQQRLQEAAAIAKETEENRKGSEEFDRKRRMEFFKKIGRPEHPAPTEDPLANFL